jgi:O-succinylbenzoic acid--CoA ligase
MAARGRADSPAASSRPARQLRLLELAGDISDAGRLRDALAEALVGGPTVGVVPAGPAPFREAARTALCPDEPVAGGPDPVVLVLLTSGSTQAPKAVELRRSALEAATAASLERLGGPGEWLLTLPCGYAGGAMVVVRALLSGQRLHVMPTAVRFEAATFVTAARSAAAAAAERAAPARRYVSLVPTQLGRLLRDPSATRALAGFDAVLVGGDMTPAAVDAAVRSVGLPVVRTYGMTETCGGCVYDGVPLRGVTVRTSDEGRITISGPVLAAGYRCQPELSASRFSSSGLVTEDLGRMSDDGRLVVLGRADDSITTGGVTISQTDVEASLLEAAGVAEAAVVAVTDPEWGRALLAAVVADPGVDLDADDVRSMLADHVPPAAIPRRVTVLAAIPRLVNGKTDRVRLRALLAEKPDGTSR